MKRAMMAAWMLVGVVWPGAVQAGSAMTQALKGVPAEAVVFVAIPSVKTLDANIGQVIKDLGLEETAGLPSNSLLAFLKQQAPFLDGIDETGAVQLVIMPANSLPELAMTNAILLPTKDPKALLAALAGQEQEGGLWSVMLMGQASYAAVRDKQVLVAQYPDALKAILASAAGMDSKLSGSMLEAIADLDFVFWFDGAKIAPQLKPMLGMVMAMSQPPTASAFDRQAMEMNKKNIDRMLDGLSMLTFGGKVTPAGVTLRGAAAFRPGSELAKQMNLLPTSGPLLHGLPADKFVFAFGQVMSPQQMEVGAEQIEDLLGLVKGVEGVDEAQAAELKVQLQNWAKMMTGYRGEVVALQPGPMGLIGANMVLDVADSGQWITLMGQMFESAKAMAGKFNAALDAPDEEFQNVLEALVFATEAEKAGDAPVTHLKLDMAKLEDLDEDELDEMLRVIGKEGMLIRMAPAGPKQVVVAFGGGVERLGVLLAAAKEDNALLSAHAGIAKVKPYLPPSRASVGYVAFDEGLDLMQNIMDALDEERLPVKVGALDAPLAMCSTGGEGWARFDMFLPREVMLAGKDVVMTMLGATRPQGAATPTPAETPEE